MAQPQLLQVKLSRFDAQPWGFRLQGGVDFAAPLLVQKVNGGSLAEQAGLVPGDAVIKINEVDVFNLRHKDAQDIVVRSGNNFVITVQRGGSTWRPHITPTGQVPQPNSPYLQTVTKTSLAHKQPQDSQHIGCGYNNAARPFANGGDGSVKSIVNKQYNTPVGIYSDESIAETLSAQAEVLAGGVLGVNFKKNEKEYQADKSEVLKFLREEETGGHSTPEPYSPANFYWTHSHAIGGNEHRRTPQQHQQQHQHDERIGATLQQNILATAATHRPSLPQAPAASSSAAPAAAASGETPDPRVIMMPVCPALQGPEYKAEMDAATAALSHSDGPRPLSASGHPACQLCGVGIVGVFVRIKDKNLHVECFKCATCGTSLKNQGYYNFNNKLYCDIHAKLAALNNPPTGTEGYVPVPIKPNTALSANTISSALSAHGFNGVPVANGNSGTPAPAPPSNNDDIDLPLPPPPSPTQLKQFENDSKHFSDSNNELAMNHTRTNSSLSSLSKGSNASTISPIPVMPIDTNSYMHYQSNSATTSSTASLDRYNHSPMHSRQTSSSSSSSLGGGLGSVVGGGNSGDSVFQTTLPAQLPPPPPPPPMPSTEMLHNTLYINNNSTQKNHNCNTYDDNNAVGNTKMLLQQQIVAPHTTIIRQLQQQNENDMNTYNKNVGTTAAATQQLTTAQQPTNNVYNKFLKEYSNKLQTQNNTNNENTTTPSPAHTPTHTLNSHNNHSIAKSYTSTASSSSASTTRSSSPTTTTTTSTINVAAVSAQLANQLKFNPCQVANHPTVAILPTTAAAPTPPPTNLLTALDNSNIYNNNNNNNNSNYNTSGSNMLANEQSIYPNAAQSTASGDAGDQPFEYITLTGNVIRSVVPPGKGANLNYKVNQGYARPFGAAPTSAAPKSPVSFPPQQQQWGGAPPQKPVGNNPYATLPRTNVGSQQGRRIQTFSKYNNSYNSNDYPTQQQYRKPNAGPKKYATMPSSYSHTTTQYNSYNNNYNRDSNDESLQPQYAEDGYIEPGTSAPPAGSDYFDEDHEISEANRLNRMSGTWPPPRDDSHCTPTAAPLYIAPPETQHVVTRPIQSRPPPLEQLQEQRTQQLMQFPQGHQAQQQQQIQSQQQPHWQSKSAPQLTNELQPPENESSSESFTSTCTTTTTTSEEYQRMYAAQVQAYQMQQAYEQSGSEQDYHMDMEVAAMQQQQQQDESYSNSTEYISGRRSAQECVVSLNAPLSTYKLIDMVREVTPSPVPQPSTTGPKYVTFADESAEEQLESSVMESLQSQSFLDSQYMGATSTSEASQIQTDVSERAEVQPEDTLVIEDRSHILETQRIFQPTPEIKFEIAPVRQIPPTKIPNSMPKEWINPMVRVLTTAPDVPFHMVECPCPKPCDCKFEAEPVRQAPAPKQHQQPPQQELAERRSSPEPIKIAPDILRESPPCGSHFTNAMVTAPEFPMLFAPPASDPIPLPVETVPYMPPPIDMKPYLREDYRPKSPFVSALTTAPEKPFEGHFDKDVPIHLIDLPTPKGHLTMSDALRTASDRAYTPLNPENATHKIEEQEREKEKKKYEFQVLDHEQELGITAATSKELAEAVEYYTTEKSSTSRATQRKSSAFAAMQAFQPSREPLTPSTPRNSVISLSTQEHESDLDYQKFCKAKERNQKRLDYFHKKEEELLQQQQQCSNQCQNTQKQYPQQQTTNTCCQASSISSCNKESSSSKSSSTVQEMPNTTTTYASTNSAAQASRSSISAAYGQTSTDVLKLNVREIIEETAEALEHSEVLFPPPSPLSHLKGKTVSSGLHKADTIPKYQRNWTVLPTQSPVRTPEPQELRENVPLAFVDASSPKTPTTAVVSLASNPVHRPVAQLSTQSSSHNHHQQQQTVSAACSSITSTTSDSSAQQRVSEQRRQQQPSSHTSTITPQQQKIKPVVPIIIEDRSGPVTMAFQSLDDHMQPDHSQTPSRPYTPSLTNKPAPIIPFYQTTEKLCFDECPATHARSYDRRSASPFPDRARSPAPGPPPNPLSAIRAPRMKENELSPISPRVLQAGSITTGQSYLGAQHAQQQQGQVLSHFETSSQAAMQSQYDKPETFEERKIGDLTMQKREKESHSAEQKQLSMQSQTKTQIGNTQVERRRKVTEEFEHTSSAKTIEIRTGSQSTQQQQQIQSSTERRQSYGKTGYVANQARRLSGLEQEISNLTSQSQAISARAANLMDTTAFPQLKSPDPEAKFPLKPVLPPHDEPTAPSYMRSPSSDSQLITGPPPGFLKQQQQQQKQVSSVYGSSLVSTTSSLQQQQKSLSAFSSSTTAATTSSSLLQSSQANAASGSLTKAYATNNNQSIATDSGVCPVTGTFCRPGHTCCKQQLLQIQQPTPITGTTNNFNNNTNNNSNAYRPNASTAGNLDSKPPSHANAAAAPSAFAAAAPPPKAAATAAASTVSAAPSAPSSFPPNISDISANLGGSSGGVGGKGVFGATSAPKRGRGIFNTGVAPGVRVPLCNSCNTQISMIVVFVILTTLLLRILLFLFMVIAAPCTNSNNANATLPRKPHATAAVTDATAAAMDAYHSQQAGPGSDDATAMLTESIGKINMGNKMDNFMAEAGKIISSMLEARLAGNNSNNSNNSNSGTFSQPLSSSDSSLSLRSNSSSNLSKSPMVVRKRLDLDDFKDLDPTEPVTLKPVVALQQQITVNASNGQQKAQPQVPHAKFNDSLRAEMPMTHPMGKVLDICDNKRQVINNTGKKSAGIGGGGGVFSAMKQQLSQPQTPPTAPPPPPHQFQKLIEEKVVLQEDSLSPMETVVYRNNSDNANKRSNIAGVLSTHAMDRRSYIEPSASAQADQIKDGPAFSISVKALGAGNSKTEPNAPMSAENEEVVSQLLKDGKRPICCQCNAEITKGPFITALGRIWCPEHFICVNGNCRRPLQDIGFVEEKGDLYCEYCFEKYLAPSCSRCSGKIKGDCLNAIGKQFHPECFTCGHCGKIFGNTPFFLEDGNAYCEADWNELFTTKCFACGFPVEAGDRWVEALNHNYHSQCFNCTYCKQNLEGQSFYNKGGRPFCKNHAR